jgi:hypothetical protein
MAVLCGVSRRSDLAQAAVIDPTGNHRRPVLSMLQHTRHVYAPRIIIILLLIIITYINNIIIVFYSTQRTFDHVFGNYNALLT